MLRKIFGYLKSEEALRTQEFSESRVSDTEGRKHFSKHSADDRRNRGYTLHWAQVCGAGSENCIRGGCRTGDHGRKVSNESLIILKHAGGVAVVEGGKRELKRVSRP